MEEEDDDDDDGEEEEEEQWAVSHACGAQLCGPARGATSADQSRSSLIMVPHPLPPHPLIPHPLFYFVGLHLRPRAA
eukprot:1534610-Pyramimonas_sp.AAC.2